MTHDGRRAGEWLSARLGFLRFDLPGSELKGCQRLRSSMAALLIDLSDITIVMYPPRVFQDTSHLCRSQLTAPIDHVAMDEVALLAAAFSLSRDPAATIEPPLPAKARRELQRIGRFMFSEQVSQLEVIRRPQIKGLLQYYQAAGCRKQSHQVEFRYYSVDEMTGGTMLFMVEDRSMETAQPVIRGIAESCAIEDASGSGSAPVEQVLDEACTGLQAAMNSRRPVD